MIDEWQPKVSIKNSSRRIRTAFLWLPKQIGYESRWLGWGTWEEECCDADLGLPRWRPIRWIDWERACARVAGIEDKVSRLLIYTRGLELTLDRLVKELADSEAPSEEGETMPQSLIKQGIEHNKNGGLSAWFADLSGSEKGQLRDEMQDVMPMVVEFLETLGEAVEKGLAPLTKWVEENSDFIAQIDTMVGRELQEGET